VTVAALFRSDRTIDEPGRLEGEPRMTSKGAEKMQNDTIGVDVSKDISTRIV
jgi:hypothetical protein